MVPTVSVFMAWDEAWAVGIGTVDSQHKKLVALINELHEAMRTRQTTAALNNVVASLVNYTKVHFAAEEDLLRKSAYPDFPAHKAEHDRFTRKVMDFQKDLTGGKVAMSIDVMQFLRSWLREHILGVDKKYVPHMRAKGVS